jgi:phospholipid N-methyltransferase
MKKETLLNAQTEFDFFETPSHHSEFIYNDCNCNDKILNVLDICCGLGSLSQIFYLNNHNITLVEMNADFIPHLKNKYPKANIINHNFLTLELKNDYDIILCNPPFNTKEIRNIYKFFFIKILKLMNSKTHFYFICPNMFIQNQIKINLNIDFKNDKYQHIEFVKENHKEPASFYFNRFGFIQLDSMDFSFDRQCIKKMKQLNIITDDEIIEYSKNQYLINLPIIYDMRFIKNIFDFEKTKMKCVLIKVII